MTKLKCTLVILSLAATNSWSQQSEVPDDNYETSPLFIGEEANYSELPPSPAPSPVVKKVSAPKKKLSQAEVERITKELVDEAKKYAPKKESEAGNKEILDPFVNRPFKKKEIEEIANPWKDEEFEKQKKVIQEAFPDVEIKKLDLTQYQDCVEDLKKQYGVGEGALSVCYRMDRFDSSARVELEKYYLSEGKNVCSVEISDSNRLAIQFSHQKKDGSVVRNQIPELEKNTPPSSPDYLRKVKQVYRYRTGLVGKVDPGLKCDIVVSKKECDISVDSNESGASASLSVGGTKLSEQSLSINDMTNIQKTLSDMGHCKPKIQDIKKTCSFGKVKDRLELTQSYSNINESKECGVLAPNGLDKTACKVSRKEFKDRSEVVGAICGNWSKECPDGIVDDQGSLIAKDQVSGWCGREISEKDKGDSVPAQSADSASKQ